MRRPHPGAAVRPRRAVHRRLHQRRTEGGRDQQPVSRPTDGHRGRRPTHAATRKMPRGTSTTFSASPTRRWSRRCFATAHLTARSACGSPRGSSRRTCPECGNAGSSWSPRSPRPRRQDRAHDREPRLPPHVQLSHRLPGGIRAARPRPDQAFTHPRVRWRRCDRPSAHAPRMSWRDSTARSGPSRTADLSGTTSRPSS
jgi:hypothetical protein